MEKVYGIDLGTTYSCIAYMDENGKPVVLKNSEEELTTPSVVHFESDNEVHVGESAKESSKLYPEQVVSFIKQYMGEPGYTRNINGKEMKPEVISSYILKKVAGDAKTALEEERKLEDGEEVKNVIITCPAYFGVTEREATAAAGRIAGLNVLDIINEPTAAAIAYGSIDDTTEKTVLVYDLGGGTFDVTMIHVKPGEIRVICTGGDKNLGGKDWDECILEYLSEEFQKETGSTEDILEDDETLQELFIAVERAKKLLSSKPKAPISINYKGERVRVELTREKFDELTETLLDRTIYLTREMFGEAEKKGFHASDISEILLVGGSTYMPQVMERVTEEFGIEAKRFDPNQAVAKGAAIYAANKQAYNIVLEEVAAKTGRTVDEVKEDVYTGKVDLDKAAEKAGIHSGEIGGLSVKPTKIINVTSRSFGVIVLNEREEHRLLNIIMKNMELPAEAKKIVYPHEDHQGNALIEVMENLSTDEMIDPGLGRKIGEAILELPPESTKTDEIETSFRLNESGLLELRAKDLRSGNKISAEFLVTDALTKEEESRAAQSVRSSNVD